MFWGGIQSGVVQRLLYNQATGRVTWQMFCNESEKAESNGHDHSRKQSKPDSAQQLQVVLPRVQV